MELRKIGEEFCLEGLNIEGGFPQQDLLKTNPNGKWVNIILVLDRPLIDNITFDEILSNNKYSLLESAVNNLNEHHFLAAYLMVIGYYIENGRLIFGIDIQKEFKIVIHIHQDKTCQPLIDLLRKYIDHMCKSLCLCMDKIFISYGSDCSTYIDEVHNYGDTNLLISLSQCAGLIPKLEPGSLIIPLKFVPCDILNKKVKLSKCYYVHNELFDIDWLNRDDKNAFWRLDDILASKFNKFAVNFVNDNYRSENMAKSEHRALEFTRKDFNLGRIAQVDRLWNPINGNELVYID